MKNLSLPLQAEWFGNFEHGSTPTDDYLMIVLHGRGDSPEGFTWMPEAFRLDGLNYLMLQAPDRYFTGFSWYDMPPRQLSGITRSRNLLNETFKILVDAGFRHDRIFLFGFSQGCLMTLEFGGRYPHVLAGYLGVSGYCYDPDLLSREAPLDVKAGNWFITHGTSDDVLTVEVTREQVKVLQHNGFQMEYREYPKGHTIDENEELPDLRDWIAARMGKS